MPYYKPWETVCSTSKQPGVWRTALWGSWQRAAGHQSRWKKNLKDEELAQERVQENTQCEGGYGQTINYVDEKGSTEHILEGASV